MGIKKDVVKEIADRIMDAALAKGKLPWNERWDGGFVLPENFTTGKRYRGFFNILGLLAAGFDLPHWAGFKQIKNAGGEVKKGEKGTTILIWKQYQKKDKETRKPMVDAKGRPVFGVYAKYTHVWNIAQTTIDPAPFVRPEPTEEDRTERLDKAESILSAYFEAEDGLDFAEVDGGGEAWYRRADDRIRVPGRTQFHSLDAYYRTVFHEAVHSTGHKSRLDRYDKTGLPAIWGSVEYSREELVAEIGAAFLCAEVGLDGTEVENDSAAYVQGWARRIKADPRILLDAANAATKAADWIMARSEVKEPAEAAAE